MLAYVGRRLGSLLITMLFVSIILFGLMHSIPGGPFELRFEKQPLPEYALENIKRKYGLDRPLYEQYARWLWAVVQGDFGIPFESPTETVTGLIARAWPVTLRVGAFTLAFAYFFGLLFGIVAAVKQNTWVDNFVTFIATLGIVLPNFIIGFILIEIFAVQLHWLPTGGFGSPEQLLMPVLAYALGPMSGIARYVRTSMLEVFRSEYVTMARARGLPEMRVILRYVLRTALIPLITILGPQIPDILTGSIFIEVTFAIPGLGAYFTTASTQRDYPMILALALLVGIFWGLTFLLSDIAYTLVDPRVRLEAVRR